MQLFQGTRWGHPGAFTEQDVEGAGSLALHGRRGVRVQVEGDCDRGVAEALGDEFRVDAPAEQERRRGVTSVMGSEYWDAGALEELAPARGHPGTARVRPSGRATTRPSRLMAVDSAR